MRRELNAAPGQVRRAEWECARCPGFYLDLPYARGKARCWELEPAPSTIEAAAANKEQHNYYDQKCGGIHDSLRAETEPTA